MCVLNQILSIFIVSTNTSKEKKRVEARSMKMASKWKILFHIDLKRKDKETKSFV